MMQTTKGTGISMKLLIAVTAALVFTSPSPAQAHHPHHHKPARHHVARHHKISVPAFTVEGEVENTSPKDAGHFLAYDNTAIGDCTYAAAANYEIAIGDPAPAEAQIVGEFHAAGGSDTEGLSIETWTSDWASNGIGSIKMLASAHAPGYAHELDGPAIALLHVNTGELVGVAISTAGGGHMVTVLGTNPEGVKIVSVGYESEMPWAQWNADAQTVYTMSDE
jgi:hypothetical protein